eukprot:GHRQ01009316.1.p3 GENE.GHRQ01009316.1~~GHRQ01009316.1.p3  ORF type:complete len:110 (-),score=7.15 GHRQ01009316.1:1589-1918(-)
MHCRALQLCRPGQRNNLYQKRVRLTRGVQHMGWQHLRVQACRVLALQAHHIKPKSILQPSCLTDSTAASHPNLLLYIPESADGSLAILFLPHMIKCRLLYVHSRNQVDA